MAPEDISLLKSLRGTFADQKSTLWKEGFWIGLFGVSLPVFFGFELLRGGGAEWPFNADEWTVLLMIPISMSLGWFFWFHLGGEYEFTESGVGLWRRGKRRNSIAWEDVHNVELQEDRFGHVTVILKGHGVRFPIRLYPCLKDEIARKGTSPNVNPETRFGTSGAAQGRHR